MCIRDRLYTWAGPEIAVASTKAYTTQLILFFMLALYMAQIKKTQTPERIEELIAKLKNIPAPVSYTHLDVYKRQVTNGTVHGAWGFSVRDLTAYDIEARAVLIATGGAAGLYRPKMCIRDRYKGSPAHGKRQERES